MTFGTAKDKDVSNRFMLIRLEPARHVSDDLSLVSGVYEMTWTNGPISKVTRLGSTKTEVSSIPVSNDTWYHDSENDKFYIKLASAPDSETNTIVVYYHLYYTGQKTRYHPESPDAAVSGSNPVREWHPRIEKYPTLTQTSRNITAGILSVAATSISLLNSDNDLQIHLGSEHSFNNKECKIWLSIDDISAIDLVYSGKVKGVSLQSGKATISIFDPFAILSQTALMRDSSDEAYWRKKTGSFPNIKPEDHDKPIPFLFGSQTPAFVSEDIPLVFGSVEGETHFVLEAYEAVCTSYVNVDSASDATKKTSNRTWGCCRLNSAGIRTHTLGTATRRYDEGGGIHHYYIPGHNIRIGETVRGFTGGTPGAVYGYCLWNEIYQISGSDYNLKLCNNSNTMISLAGFDPIKTVTVLLWQPGFIRPVPIRQTQNYNVFDDSTTGGNQYVRVVFLNSFENNSLSVGGSTPAPLNPNTDRVFFVAYSATVDDHSSALKRIIEKAGLTANSASFTQASSDLSANSRFTIPMINETDFGSYRNYCEEILKSTLGLLKINSSNEAVYEVLDAPSSSDVTDSSEYMDRSLSIDIDYNDIKTQLIGYNPHITKDEIDLEQSNTSSASAESNKAKYLHDLENINRFEHVLERIDNRIDKHMDIQSNRRARYKFKTATKHLDSLIGDDIQLDSDKVLGGSGSVDLTITRITKDGTSTTIEAEDLEGL